MKCLNIVNETWNEWSIKKIKRNPATSLPSHLDGCFQLQINFHLRHVVASFHIIPDFRHAYNVDLGGEIPEAPPFRQFGSCHVKPHVDQASLLREQWRTNESTPDAFPLCHTGHLVRALLQQHGVADEGDTQAAVEIHRRPVRWVPQIDHQNLHFRFLGIAHLDLCRQRTPSDL